MIGFGVGRYTVGISVVAIMLAGCGGGPPTMSAGVPASAAFTRAMTGPPACKRENKKKQYGSIVVKLRSKGGSFCVPAFGGFGGTMQYPRADRSAKLTIRTSTANIYNQPQLGTGTSIVYLNLHFHAGTRFGSTLKSNGGLTSQTISPGGIYTAYGIVAVGHLDFMFPPCYTVATQGPYGGVLPNLGNLFRSAIITGVGFGVIEIYSGQQVSQQC
jgi:hypothetical protein